MDNSRNYEILKKVINEVDPLGLIDFGTPENEYEPELKEIFTKNISQFNNAGLSEWIRNVFVSYFNENLANGREKYDLIANKYIDAVNKKEN